MREEVVLKAIDAKLAALLAIWVDQYLRDTGIARPKARSIDRMLADAGLSTREIAALLGKTDRAVNLVLASGRAGKAKGGSPRRRSTSLPVPRDASVLPTTDEDEEDF